MSSLRVSRKSDREHHFPRFRSRPWRRGRGSFLGLALGLVIAQAAVAAAPAADPKMPVRYSVSFQGREQHEARVRVLFTDLGTAALDLRMSRTSPGRYRLHEFAKNVYDLSAHDALGGPLEVTTVRPSNWLVKKHGGTVEVTYTVFGDLLSGTYDAIESRLAVLNPPATFLWAEGLENRPVVVSFDLPFGWQVVTQMMDGPTSGTVEAPNLEYFFDSPVALGTFGTREWTVDSGGRAVLAGLGGPADGPGSRAGEGGVQSVQVKGSGPSGSGRNQRLRLAVHDGGTGGTGIKPLDRFEGSLQALVAEATAVFGELPRFAFGRYSFIGIYLPNAHDDAMEHRDSTLHSSSKSPVNEQSALLLTLVHEFFHIWNVERIRPSSLEPFDYEDLNLSTELWFAEGFTSYYAKLILVRSGVWSEADYLKSMTTTVNRFLNSPARQFGGAAAMSLRAPYHDRAVWVDPTNTQNTYLHYYDFGEALALALDLELRSRWDSDLDRFMKRVWLAHGVDERPYGQADLEKHLAAETDAEFARSFFSRFVDLGGTPDFPGLLETVGLVVETPGTGAAWLGFSNFTSDGKGAVLADESVMGTPLYRAGLGRGDRITELDGRSIRNADDIQRVLKRHRPGDSVRLVSERRLEWREGEIALGEDPTVVVAKSKARGSNDVTEGSRAKWLGTRVSAPPVTSETGQDGDQ